MWPNIGYITRFDALVSQDLLIITYFFLIKFNVFFVNLKTMKPIIMLKATFSAVSAWGSCQCGHRGAFIAPYSWLGQARMCSLLITFAPAKN